MGHPAFWNLICPLAFGRQAHKAPAWSNLASTTNRQDRSVLTVPYLNLSSSQRSITMRSRLATSILILACILAVMTIPASAAPAQQQGGWTSTHYVLIDGTRADRQPTVVYSDIAGVRVTRVGPTASTAYIVRFLRPYRFLIADAYAICTEDDEDNCVEFGQGYGAVEYITWNSTLREWVIGTSRPDVMLSLIVKP
jgi:hypothetical protein